MRKRIVLLLLLTAAAGVAVWAVFRFTVAKRERLLQSANNVSNLTNRTNSDAWAEAVERVKAYRTEPTDGTAALEIPSELKHYSDRHWFLASQVAEIGKYKVQTCQDYVDLAAMIKGGEMVAVPAVTGTYVLYGVGAKADQNVFTRFENDHSIELYTETQLGDAYRRLDNKRSELQSEIAALEVQLGRVTKRDRTKQRELQKQIAARQQELKSTDENKALLDQFYGQPVSRQKLFRDYESLQALANNFGGRSYNISDPSDRQAMKINMLSSLRPEALKIVEEVALVYHQQFERPLPVSSLVRPEQYQHALSKVNRNAVLIETPPHSTGLAFDIDYRYMSAAEQTFVMATLARLKREGRIEAIRERSANYHVFAFLNGSRPSDAMITASLDKARAPVEAQHVRNKSANVKSKSQKDRTMRAPRSSMRRNGKRRH
jgi:prefoldin subunit 5